MHISKERERHGVERRVFSFIIHELYMVMDDSKVLSLGENMVLMIKRRVWRQHEDVGSTVYQ